jgi:hypothetical protein
MFLLAQRQHQFGIGENFVREVRTLRVNDNLAFGAFAGLRNSASVL